MSALDNPLASACVAVGGCSRHKYEWHTVSSQAGVLLIGGLAAPYVGKGCGHALQTGGRPIPTYTPAFAFKVHSSNALHGRWVRSRQSNEPPGFKKHGPTVRFGQFTPLSLANSCI